jgi:hypothetical protein
MVAGGRVVYRADARYDEQFELWSVPLLEGGGAPTRSSGELSLLGSVETDFALAGTKRVVYRADAAVDGTFSLWSVPLDASQEPRELGMPLDPGPIIGEVTEFRWTRRRSADPVQRLADAYDRGVTSTGVFSADLSNAGDGAASSRYLGSGHDIAASSEETGRPSARATRPAWSTLAR